MCMCVLGVFFFFSSSSSPSSSPPYPILFYTLFIVFVLSFSCVCLSACLSIGRDTEPKFETLSICFVFRDWKKMIEQKRREEKDRHNGQQQRKRRRRRRKITTTYKLQAQLKRKHNEMNQAKWDFFLSRCFTPSLPFFLSSSILFHADLSCLFFSYQHAFKSRSWFDSIETIKAMHWRSGGAMRKRSLLFKMPNKKNRTGWQTFFP